MSIKRRLGHVGIWAAGLIVFQMFGFDALQSMLIATALTATSIERTGTKTMSIKRRLGHVGIWATIFLILFYLGTNIVLPAEEAKQLITALAEATANIGEGDPLFIASHNIGISLVEFIPGIGFVWGAFSALQTGMVVNVMSAEIEGMEPWMGLLLFITPVGIIELAAYAMAMSRSWLWTRLLFSKERRTITNIKAMLKPTFIEVGILVGLLILGGYVESWMINEYGSMSLDLLDKYR